MAKAIVRSESGDWFLVPWEKRYDFDLDELEENAEYAEYIGGHPNLVKILEYEKV